VDNIVSIVVVWGLAACTLFLWSTVRIAKSQQGRSVAPATVDTFARIAMGSWHFAPKC